MKFKLFTFVLLITMLFNTFPTYAFDTSNIIVDEFIDPISGVYGLQYPSIPDELFDSEMKYYLISFNMSIERAFLYITNEPFKLYKESDTYIRTSYKSQYITRGYVDFSAGADSSQWTLWDVKKYDSNTYGIYNYSDSSKAYPVYCNYDLVSAEDSNVIWEACEIGQTRLNDGFHTDQDITPTPSPDEPTSAPSSDDGDDDGILSSIIDILTSIPERIANAFTGLIDKIISSLEDLVVKFNDLIVFLFVPKDNKFLDIIDVLNTKFVIFEQAFNILTGLFNQEISDEPPSFPIELNGVRYYTLDFSFLDSNIELVRGIIGFFCIMGFLRWLLINIPNIVMGQGLAERDNYVQELPDTPQNEKLKNLWARYGYRG